MNSYEQMREALEEARDALDTIMSTSCHNLREITASRAYRKCREALALPRRQCDVGTPEEQYKRFQDFCLYNSFRGVCSEHCPLYKPSIGSYQNTGRAICFPAWSQMPYEAEESEATDGK